MPRHWRGESDPVEIVREMYELVTEQGPRALVERYDEWFSEDFVWESVVLASLDGRSGAFRGKAEFASYWDEFAEGFADVTLGDGTFELVGPGRVLVTAELRASGAASGAPIGRLAGYLFQVKDGLITEGRSFLSPQDARRYLANA